MSKWPKLQYPEYTNWFQKVWNWGKDPVPYPRKPGESEEDWWHRIYPSLCETIYTGDEPYGAQVNMYLEGNTFKNGTFRTALVLLVAVPLAVGLAFLACHL